LIHRAFPISPAKVNGLLQRRPSGSLALSLGDVDAAEALAFGKNTAGASISSGKLCRVFSSIAVGLLYVVLIGAPQLARAQCTTNGSNGGILQNGGGRPARSTTM
jgi:hypothetical protein